MPRSKQWRQRVSRGWSDASRDEILATQPRVRHVGIDLPVATIVALDRISTQRGVSRTRLISDILDGWLGSTD